MKSKRIKTIFKYFMESYQIHEEVWIMRPKFKNFEPVINSTYGRCYEDAEKQIKEKFEFGNP